MKRDKDGGIIFLNDDVHCKNQIICYFICEIKRYYLITKKKKEKENK